MYINAEDTISRFLLEIGDNDTSLAHLAKSWVYDACKLMSGKDNRSAAAAIEIHNCRIQKPENYVKIIDLALYSQSDSGDLCAECFPVYVGSGDYKRSIYSENRPNPDARRTGVNLGQVTYSEAKTHFDLSTGGGDYDFAYLMYISTPLSLSGEIMIHNEEEVAVLAYLRYCYMARVNMQRPGTYPAWQVASSEKDWLNKKRSARGQMKMPSAPEMRRVIANEITLVPKISRSRGFKLNK